MKKFLSVLLIVAILCTVMIVSVSANTVVGPGGTASIEALESQKEFTWTAKPKTNWPYNFHGTIEYTNVNNGETDWSSVGGSGIMGSKVTGEASPHGLGTGTVYATLTGTADALFGTDFVVLPGCVASQYFTNN